MNDGEKTLTSLFFVNEDNNESSLLLMVGTAK